MKLYRMERTYIKCYWESEVSFKRTKRLNYLFNMMLEASYYREEITTLFFRNKITKEEYSQKYELLGQMERKVQHLLHEVQCHINEMELELIYNS